MAYSCVRVQFEIGHEASIRNKRTPEGFTHDWEVFVRGVDNADIHHFIDKVVFLLHDTFPKPKRIVKEPPYCVKESGYAGFNLPIDIYFKGKDEQRKARFYYDLTLQNSGPRISKVIREKADFPNPSEDFRRKLIKGGGVGIGSDGANSSIDKNTNNNNVNASEEKKSSPLTSKPKVSSSSDPAKKHKTKDKELMKQDELKTSNYFAELFGTPIKTVKHSPTNSKPLQVKPLQSDKPIHEKQIKETSKSSKHSPHKEKEREGKESLKKEKEADRSSSKEKERSKEKDKESHREKEKNKEKFAKKPSSPVPVRTLKEEVLKKVPDENKEKINSKVEGLKVEKKHKEKKRDDKERKHHDKKEVDKEKNYDKSEKKVDSSKENKDSQKSKTPLSKDEKKPKTVEKDKERTSDVEKQRHKHKKKDKHKDEEKERQKKKDNDKLPVEVPKVKPKSPSPPPPTPPALQTLPQHTPQINPKSAIRPLNRLLEELPDKDSDSDLSITNEEDGKCEPPPEPALIIKSKVEEKKFDPKEEKVRKKDKKLKEDDKESRKRKRKMKDKEEPTEKAFKVDLKEEGRSDKSPAVSKNDDSRSPSPQTVFTEDYVTQLKDLQHKIMTLQDNADLQRVVQVISETGQFEITPRTFDFDLCALDPSTVKRLQDMFIAAS